MATSFLKLGGLVTFSARRATAAELEAEGLPSEHGSADGDALAAEIETLADRRAQGAETSQAGEGGKGGGRSASGRGEAKTARGEEGGEAEEETVLEVKAKVCRSILSADITELQFLEACPGASYVKEFSVWNK